jgi:ribonuclease-3
LVGAIYLDKGTGAAKQFIEEALLYKTEETLKGGLKDAKSLLQERAQAKYSVTPTYRTLKEWGLDHDKRFRVGAFLGKKKIAEGEGKSKQSAEDAAAQEALQKEAP